MTRNKKTINNVTVFHSIYLVCCLHKYSVLIFKQIINELAKKSYGLVSN